MNLNKRDQKEILEYLKLITDELTDAYNSTPDTSENSDALYFIDTARDLVDELVINVEDNQEIKNLFLMRIWIEKVDLKLITDRLPLNFPFGDGEGRLKGHN